MLTNPSSCDRVDERRRVLTPCGRTASPASPVTGLLELLPASSDRGEPSLALLVLLIECIRMVYYHKIFYWFLGIALRLE